MRRMYESLNRKKRAEDKRKAGRELEKAGFFMFAKLNYDEALALDPPKEEPEFTEY